MRSEVAEMRHWIAVAWLWELGGYTAFVKVFLFDFWPEMSLLGFFVLSVVGHRVWE
jgi:hypothetical protein